MLAAVRNLSFVEKALAFSALASGALLAGAHLFQAYGYAPCALCLDQREAHWAALGVAAAGLAASIIVRAPIAAAAAVGALALVYAVSAGLSFFHVGVEWGFWPGPASCAGGFGGVADISALNEALTQRVIPPSCSEAAWRLFGVSMAGYNLLVSAGLFAIAFAAALGAAREAKRARRPAPPVEADRKWPAS